MRLPFKWMPTKAAWLGGVTAVALLASLFYGLGRRLDATQRHIVLSNAQLTTLESTLGPANPASLQLDHPISTANVRQLGITLSGMTRPIQSIQLSRQPTGTVITIDYD